MKAKLATVTNTKCYLIEAERKSTSESRRRLTSPAALALSCLTKVITHASVNGKQRAWFFSSVQEIAGWSPPRDGAFSTQTVGISCKLYVVDGQGQRLSACELTIVDGLPRSRITFGSALRVEGLVIIRT